MRRSPWAKFPAAWRHRAHFSRKFDHAPDLTIVGEALQILEHLRVARKARPVIFAAASRVEGVVEKSHQVARQVGTQRRIHQTFGIRLVKQPDTAEAVAPLERDHLVTDLPKLVRRDQTGCART